MLELVKERGWLFQVKDITVEIVESMQATLGFRKFHSFLLFLAMAVNVM